MTSVSPYEQLECQRYAVCGISASHHCSADPSRRYQDPVNAIPASVWARCRGEIQGVTT